jgi:hypothetical protein
MMCFIYMVTARSFITAAYRVGNVRQELMGTFRRPFLFLIGAMDRLMCGDSKEWHGNSFLCVEEWGVHNPFLSTLLAYPW